MKSQSSLFRREAMGMFGVGEGRIEGAASKEHDVVRRKWQTRLHTMR